MRESRLKIVVLPAPLGPMIVKTAPASTSKLTPASALMPPKLIARSSTCRRLIRLAGGPDMAPRPPALGRAPAKPWRASGLTVRVSPQPLRAHVRLLAAERRALVEGEHREVKLDLRPAPVNAQWLEQNEQHEDEAEEPGLEPRLLHEAVEPAPRRNGVPSLRDQHR